MSHVTFLLHHAADDFISNGIAFFSHAEASHVAMLHPEGHSVLEASGMGNPKGVRVVPKEGWAARHEGYWIRRVSDPDPHEIWDIAVSYEGAGYDWFYFLGWLLRMKIENPAKFVCQELLDLAFRKAGRPLFTTARPYFLTPQHFHMLPSFTPLDLISQPMEQ